MLGIFRRPISKRFLCRTAESTKTNHHPEVEDAVKRAEIGNRFISGSGFEIGAGLAPSHYTGTQNLTFIDKRTAEELQALFGSRPAYPVMQFEEAQRAYARGGDFVIAHHVIEHCANPIKVLQEWLSLVRDEGLLFISLPSSNNACEKDRIITPIEHVLDDYLFERNGDDYDSKQHIPSFINQWTVMDPNTFWYAKEGLEKYAAVSLGEMRRNGNDLHWHTYTLPVAVQMVEAALYFSHVGFEWIRQEETSNCIYLLCRRVNRQLLKPECLKSTEERFKLALNRLA